MPKVKDRTGLRYGMLVVIRMVQDGARPNNWLCRCDCGNEVIVRGSNLASGNTKSCDCRRRGPRKDASKYHPEYIIWKAMRQRCFDVNAISYHNYGGRGITICKEWDSFKNFLKDMGPRPSPSHQIDRKDNEGNYNLENCRWVIPKVNSRNRRSTRYIEFAGETLALAAWCERLNLPMGAISARIQSGWTIERAFNTPIGAKRTKVLPRRVA